MPTATRISQAWITNFGPLTTTHTAPASCATETNHIYFGAESDKPEYHWANPTCTMQLYGKCIPSGDQYDHLITASFSKTFDIGFYHYYSPGLYCPSNWTTVGKFVQGTGSAVQISGALTMTESEPVNKNWELGRPFPANPSSVWNEVLEPLETLAVCCPSDYKLDFSGNCYSVLGNVSSYGYTEICGFAFAPTAVPLTSTISGHEVKKYTEPIPLSTFTRDMDTGEMEGGSPVVSRVPAVALIHQEADFTKAGGDDDTKENSGKRMNERSHATLLLAMAVMTTLAISGL